MANTFTEIYRIVRRIPPGQVLSYGDVAAMCKSAVSARTVGWAMSVAPPGVPWFRVVNHRGELSIGKRSITLAELQRNLLEAEGVAFTAPDRVNMEQHRWRLRPAQHHHHGPHPTNKPPIGVTRRSSAR